ncbi:MAG: response regulator [Desulfobacterales bacterium]|nr:response regulator [Desulfobacterales bacterium]
MRDILLVESEAGRVVYSVEKETDLGVSLMDGPSARTSLGRVFRAANQADGPDRVFMVDFESYAPSYDEPACFIASPVFDGEKKTGVAVFQIDAGGLREILGEGPGPGKTGRAFLVGPDRAARSEFHRSPEPAGAGDLLGNGEKARIDTAPVRAALSGGAGVSAAVNERGAMTLSAYTPVKAGDFTWALVVEIPAAEALRPAAPGGDDYFTMYKTSPHYEDLLLVDPTGYCFFSAAKSPDHKTNLLSDGRENSNLGALVKQVLKSGRFGMVDFKPRPNGDHEPAAYIAQPAVYDGAIEAILILRLSLDAINDVMRTNKSLGRSGEACLVGPDRLMRSDSRLDPVHFSVQASFTDPVRGRVDAEAVRRALAGRTGASISEDYTGAPALSAYTPLKVGSVTWALVAWIHEAEVKNRGWLPRLSLWIAVLIAAALTAAFALFFASGIAGQMDEITTAAENIARGELKKEIQIRQEDEIGALANALREARSRINAALEETDRLIRGVRGGDLDALGASENHAGGWRDIILGMNRLIQSTAALYDHASAAVMIIDADFTIRFVNRSCAELTGEPRERLKGRPCHDVLRTTHCRTERCALTRAMNSGETVTGEAEARPGETSLAVSYTGVPFMDRAGVIRGLVLTIVEHGEARKAMAAAGYLDQIPTTVMVVDREFNIRFINQAGASLHEKTPDACLGLKCYNLFNTGHCHTSDCQAGAAMIRDGVFTSDTMAHPISGDVPIRYTGSPVKDDQGAVVGALVYAIDIGKEMEITGEVLNLAEAALGGKLGTRLNVEKFKGSYRQIVRAINDALDAIIRPLNMAAEFVNRISKGDIPEKIEDEYKGDFNEIRNNLNALIDATNEIIYLAGEIAEGNLDVDVRERSEGDRLMRMINAMTGNLREVAGVADAIAMGDFTRLVQLRGKKDLFGKTINRMTENLRKMAELADAIASGDYRRPVEIRGEKDLFGKAIARMTENLSAMTEKSGKENWLKTGLNELNERMRGEPDTRTLTQNILNYLGDRLNARVGVCYLMETEASETEGTLRLVSGYAHKLPPGAHDVYKLGEGLIGQAALEKKSILFTRVPEDHVPMIIDSGMGRSRPRDIFILPLIHEERVLGILGFGTHPGFTDVEMEFLDLAAETIAVSLHSARSRAKTRELLETTRLQSRELNAQREELMASNEELEERSRALRESREKLKIQSEELQATNEELEEKTEVLVRRTRDLEKKKAELESSRRKIQEKMRDLERVSKYKSEFLANMSHELRTPLNSLLLLAGMLSGNEEGNLTDRQVESVKVIHASGKDLLNIINDILDLSKIEAGKMDFLMEDVEVDAIISNLKDQFNPVAEDKQVAFRVDIAEDSPRGLKTDGGRIQQILRNLLSNAFKFTRKGRVSLNVHLPRPGAVFFHDHLTPDAAVTFSVEDTGLGIAADKQADIFRAFQQADGSTSRKYGGTGLGLTISRMLARSLGGEIQLRSEEGKGSVFMLHMPLAGPPPTVSLPVEKEPLPAPPPPAPKHDGNNGKNRYVRKDGIEPAVALSEPEEPEFLPDDRKEIGDEDKVILVIEDDIRFARTLNKIIREKGYKFIGAASGESGLTLATRYKPFAIILDIGLPDISGLRVLDNLKAEPRTRHIPVHIISVLDEISGFVEKGVVGWLTKPASPEDIDAVLIKFEELLLREKKEILLVDGDPAVRKSIVDRIENEWIRITEAGDGEEAWRRITTQKFNLVILEPDLPDREAFDLLEKLKKERGRESFEPPPVILYTSRELSREEHAGLSEQTGSIVVKGAGSPERLQDEVFLFLRQPGAPRPAAPKKPPPGFRDPGRTLQGRKVLLVDDDLRNSFALSSILGKYDLEIAMADNGRLALEKLDKDERIDLVLMDIMMPVMDGYETMRRIREQERFKNLPIIAITAKAMPEDRAKCIEAGANDYLTKPVDGNKLIAMLKIWLFEKRK